MLLRLGSASAQAAHAYLGCQSLRRRLGRAHFAVAFSRRRCVISLYTSALDSWIEFIVCSGASQEHSPTQPHIDTLSQHYPSAETSIRQLRYNAPVLPNMPSEL